MPAYIIGYDLHRPGRNYPELFDAIKKVGTNWWHCLDSTWIVISHRGAGQIRDFLTPHMDANDTVVVLKYDNDWASYGLSTECSDWLSNNL